MTAAFLTGAALLIDGAWVHGHGLLLEDGLITAIQPADTSTLAPRVALPPGSLLAPGLIDIQVNGGGGLLFNDAPTQATARAIAAAHRRLGTTSILPTLITDTPATMRQAAAVLAEPSAGLLGLHFEGPFLSPARPGVHRPDLIRPPTEPDLALFEELATRQPGRIVLTLAPETVTDDHIRRLAAAGILLCAGHTAASFDRTTEALAAGITGFDAEEAEFKRMMLERSERSIVALTNDKLSTVAPFWITALADIDDLVIEADAPEAKLEGFAASGPRLHRAAEDRA